MTGKINVPEMMKTLEVYNSIEEGNNAKIMS